MKVGEKYNKLTAVKFVHKDKWRTHHWLFQCDCGNEKIMRTDMVKSGNSKSCGCIRNKDKITHGMTNSKIYSTWEGMKQRCSNKNFQSYKNYGGRGIKVCNRWKKFKNFYKDMRGVPKGKTLDRIDNNGSYCKENCRWATQEEQMNNTRRNKFLTYKGKTQTITSWSRETKIHRNTIDYRVAKGFSVSKILSF